MKIGERLYLEGTLDDENMAYLKQLGVNNLMVGITDPVKNLRIGPVNSAGESEVHPLASKLRRGDYYDVDDLVELRRLVESRGFSLFGISHTPFSRWEKIIRGLPGRDQQIENWNKSLQNMGKAGILMLQYNWVIDAGAWLINWANDR